MKILIKYKYIKMTELLNFIELLDNFSDSEHIQNYEELKNSLNKLYSMIGMKEIKRDIITQIQFYLVNCVRKTSSLDSHMFHTVLTGPPGCGKTTVAEIMAEIWVALGIIKPVEEPKPKIILDSLLDFIDNQKELDELKEKNDNLQNSIRNKNDVLIETLELVNKIHIPLNQFKKSHDRKHFRLCKKRIESVKERLNQGISIYTREIKLKPKIDTKNLVIKLRRDDLIGKYVGHTAVKTREALMKGLGKVIFIDEAYELYNTTGEGNDSFGMECLNTILSFINEHSDKCIIIFAGYEDLLNKTIFRVQPGLQRRIAWNFKIEKYSAEELTNIFEKQLSESSWILENKIQTIELLKRNEKLFKFAGGDTLRLAMYVKNIFSKVSFEKLIKNEPLDSIITMNMLKEAIKILEQNQEVLSDKNSEPPPGMYI